MSDTGIKLGSLDDISQSLSEPAEDLKSCIGIAAQKALSYADQLGENYLVLTQDDTLQFLGISPEDNPGVSIKDPVITAHGEFNDENALRYYTDLVKKYGHPIEMRFEYGHSLAEVFMDAPRPGLKLLSSQSSLRARLVDDIRSPELVPGYFMCATMEVYLDGEWIHYMELTEDQKVKADGDIKQSITALLKQFS